MCLKLWNQSVQIAYELANQPGSIHIACLYHKNKLVSIGRNNKEKENAKAVYFARVFGIHHWQKYPYIHAEMDALSRAWKTHHIDKNYSIVSLRISMQGSKSITKLCMAKPCINCSKVLKALSCKVIYSNKEGSYAEV